MGEDSSRRRFVLLDRDGTLIRERYYLSDPDALTLIPGVGAALGELKALGFGLAVMTNQAGVGRGLFSQDQLDRVHRRLGDVLAREGAGLDGIYACIHSPEDDCPCRKPKLGLFEQAQRKHRIDPSESFMIGDKAIDIEFGRAAGVTTILVRTGYGRDVERDKTAEPHYIVDDLPAAAHLIRQLVASEP